MAKVQILIGVPGSGKTHYANSVCAAGRICSADKYFKTNSGKYVFDPSKLARNHSACLNWFFELARHRPFHSGDGFVSDIIVDNTNIHHWEWQNYFAIAREFLWPVEFHVWEPPSFDIDFNVVANRQLHGVPMDKIRQMADELELPFGPYFQHFIHSSSSSREVQR